MLWNKLFFYNSFLDQITFLNTCFLEINCSTHMLLEKTFLLITLLSKNLFIFQHKNISETKLSTLGFQTLNWIKSFFFHPFFVLTRLSFKIVTIYFENFFFVQNFLQDRERLQSEHFNWESILQFEAKNNLQKCRV